MDRRTFLLGAGIAGVAACAKPERDFLEPYEGVDIPLEPGTAQPSGSMPDPTPMQSLRESVAAEDRPGLSFVARARVPSVDVHEAPGDENAPWSFTHPTASGDDLVFLVEDYDGLDHYQVLLPIRPNGSFGWIHRDDVDLLRHNFAIRVELAQFRLTVLEHDQGVFTTTVGVARDNAPTPLGRYYTTEIIRPTEPDSVYGAFAYGLSGFSETFTTFRGGPGQLGIHGTNDPESIGTNVSSGCIRMINDDITRLVEDLGVPTGVPVEVV